MRKWSKYSLTGLVLAALLMLFGSCGKKDKPASNEINVGVILPLSGNLADAGASFLNAIRLGARGINQDLSARGLAIKLHVEDDQDDAKTALNAYKKLTSVDKVSIIVGLVRSKTAQPVVPLLVERKVLLISPFATASDLSRFTNYFYRICVSDTADTLYLAKHFAARGLQGAAVLHANDDWGRSWIFAFTRELSRLGGQVVDVESYESGGKDMRTQLTKIKSSGADCLLLIGTKDELVAAVRQAVELKVNLPIFGSHTFLDEAIVKLLGSAADGITFITGTPADRESHVFRDFAARYSQEYGKAPDDFSMHGYDGMLVLGKALGEGHYTAESINSFLKLNSGKTVISGTTGDIQFDTRGDAVKQPRLMIITNGHFVPLL